MATSGDGTVGVEEELFLVDAATTALVPRGAEIVDAGGGQFEAVLASGNSATRQRASFRRRERMEDSVEHLVAETAEGLPAGA